MGTGWDGIAQVFGGINQSNAMKSEAKMAEFEAKMADVRGIQVSASRRDELNRTLAAIDTSLAAGGAGMDSATSRAIRKDRRDRSAVAENTEVLGERLVGVSRRNKAAGLRSGAKWAKISGFVSGASSFAKAAAQASSGGGG